MLHALLLTGIGLYLHRAPSGTGDAPDRPVGIAMVHHAPDRTEFVTEPDVAEEQTDEPAERTAGAADEGLPPADAEDPLDLDDLLASATDVSAPAGAARTDDAIRPGGGGGDAGGGRVATGGETATTELFGISGTGNRFVYVFDRSESMNGFGGAPLRAAKSQLIASLRSLGLEQQFQVIFYNSRPTPLGTPGQVVQLNSGDRRSIDRAEQLIRAVEAFGGTEHEAALKMGLRMSPDVIFFLTDARLPRLSAARLDELRTRALRSGTSIHCIEFGVEPGAPAESFVKDLAALTDGEYRYINVNTLGNR